jgi:type II secretory pathway pseudopilin PulG
MPLLLLLISLAVAGATLARLGERWQVQAQRERETELLFRGQQIANAILAYQRATLPGQPSLPQALEDLLEDRRDGQPRHWLRQLYADPFSGLPDWELLRDADGGVLGVRSRADRVALRQHGLAVPSRSRPGEPMRVGDWIFMAPRVAGRAARRPPGTDQGPAAPRRRTS